jgi:hypothetical protein
MKTELADPFKSELKLFVDGVEVKKGDELIRGSTVIIFDRVNRSGEIVDSEGKLWTNYPDYNGTLIEWERRSSIELERRSSQTNF